MKLASDGKINADGVIFSNEMIIEKEGYEAMLYMLQAYFEAMESKDLTDILVVVDIGVKRISQWIQLTGNIG